MIKIVPLDAEKDFDRVADLFDRAADYVRLESGKDPAPEFVHEQLTDKPPVCGPDDIFLRGLEKPDGSLAGFASSIRHFYEPGDWYMGLLILDPAKRGAGLGKMAAEAVIEEARQDGARLIRIAVLDKNPRGRKFWEGLGFVLERTVPAEDNDDGNERHVLKKAL